MHNFRIYKIRVPQLDIHYTFFHVIFWGIGAVWLICFFIGFNVYTLLPTHIKILILIYVVSAFGLVIHYFWLRYVRLNRPQKRVTRLVKLLSYSGAYRRFPHRAIEYHYRCPPWFRSRQEHRFIKYAKPGTIILLKDFNDDEFEIPNTIEISFEPIKLPNDIEQLALIKQINSTGIQVDEHFISNCKSHKKDTVVSAFKAKLAAYAVILFVCCLAICFFIPIIILLFAGSLGITLFFMLGLLILMLMAIPTFYEKQIWLVPGGLVYRHYQFWKKNMKWDYIHAKDAVLFWNFRRSTIHILHDGKSYLIDCPLEQSILSGILAAWMSNIHPSEEDIRAYLGVDVVSDRPDVDNRRNTINR